MSDDTILSINEINIAKEHVYYIDYRDSLKIIDASPKQPALLANSIELCIKICNAYGWGEAYVYSPTVIDKYKIVNGIDDIYQTKEPIRILPLGKILIHPVTGKYEWIYRSLVDTNIVGNISEAKFYTWIADPKFTFKTDINKLNEAIAYLDKTPYDRIFTSTDWHLFKEDYSDEKNLIDFDSLFKWCYANIKPSDAFIYLGDLTYRKADLDHIKKAFKLVKAIKAKMKIWILGNHDIILKNFDYVSENSPFNYICEELEWKDFIFTHVPISGIKDGSKKINIHGHIHEELNYYDSWNPDILQGKHHINPYPALFDNKLVDLQYIMDNKDEIIKQHYFKITEPTRYKVTKHRQELLDRYSSDTYNESAINDNNEELPEDIKIVIPQDKEDFINILENTPYDHIWLSSDWHLFKNHYKHEKNLVNVSDIVEWCHDHIKPDDIFMYLGDICYRYASKEDQDKATKIMAALPGHKVLILGNHDVTLGQQYYKDCGFEYVFSELRWRDMIFSHRPLKMEFDKDKINIHGHMHDETTYRTSNGDHHINVYPSLYHNKPVQLQYLLDHKDDLMKDHTWFPNKGYGESVNYPTSSLIRAIAENYRLNNNAYLCLETALDKNKESNKSKKKSVVYYSRDITTGAIARLVNILKDNLTKTNIAIKLHVGEKGNENYLDPELLQDTVQRLGRDNVKFIDCNIAYEGARRTTQGHLKVAKDHKFTNICDIDIIDSDGQLALGIPDRIKIKKEVDSLYPKGKKPPYESPVTMGEHLDEIYTGTKIKNYDSMIVYTHVKGHTIAGFGGAIKNVGMGLASGLKGKLQIHGEHFEILGKLFMERLVESASAIISRFEDKIVYINVLGNISLDCDCDAGVTHDDCICKDICVLASTDIVAIEQASLDIIRQNPNTGKLVDRIADKAGHHQVEYAEWLNMGNSDYVIKDISNNVSAISENTISHPSQASNPEELKDYMLGNILYDYESVKNINQWKLKSPAEVLHDHSGDCHSQAYFEKYWLEKMGYKTRLYFMMEYNNDNEPGGRTHTLCTYIKDGKLYWIENAWSRANDGIHGPYNSDKDLENAVKRIWFPISHRSKFKNFHFSPAKYVPFGSTFEEYISAQFK